MRNVIVTLLLFISSQAHAVMCYEIIDDRARLRCWDEQSHRATKGKDVAIAEYIIGTTIVPGVCGYSLNDENAAYFKRTNELDDFTLWIAERPDAVQRAIDDAGNRSRNSKAAFCDWAYEYYGPDSLSRLIKKRN